MMVPSFGTATPGRITRRVFFLFALLLSSALLPAAPAPGKSGPWRLPGGIAGQSYSQSLMSYEPTWKKWTLLSSGIPGLELKTSGTLVGIPTTEGIYRLSLAALDNRGRQTRLNLVVAISSQIGPPGPAQPTDRRSALPVSSCRALEADKDYQLQQDVGLDQRAVCFRIAGPNVHLDLHGHTVQGRIAGKAIDVNGIEIDDGTVNCNFGDTETDHGCIELTSEASPSKTVFIHDINVKQLSTVSDNAARALHIDWTAKSGSLPVTTPAVRLSGITASVSASKGHRSPVLGVQGSGITVEVDHNQISCPTGSNACQGIVCYGIHGCWVHANRIVLAPSVRIEETARAILFDQLNQSPTDFGEAWNNIIVANEGRAFRIRSAFNVWVHDNRILSVENSSDTQNYVGAIHLGDPDSGVDDLKDTRIFRNTIELGRRGVVIFARNTRDAIVENNTILCVAPCVEADFASVRAPLEAADATKLSLRNNVGSGISLESDVERGAELNICNSGSTAGKGRISRSNDCNQK